MDEIIQGEGFTIRVSKFDFFFGRVTSNPDNTRRSSDNLENLKMLGIQEERGGRERLLQIFAEGLDAPELPQTRKVTKYGVNLSRKVEVIGNEHSGAIIVRYFYPNGNLDNIPQVTSIIVLIYPETNL
ncbi:MAG: hypothetical protein AB4290_04720 [Spirulina sp.]